MTSPSQSQIIRHIFRREFLSIAQDITIRGNTIKFATGVEWARVFPIVGYNLTNSIIAQNRVHAPNVWSGPIAVYYPQNVVITGNIGLLGENIGDFGINQIEIAQSISRRTVSGATTLTSADKYVGVSVSSATTITLPHAAGRAGKEFIIVDEGGNAATYNITIATTASQTINGQATYTINANRGAVSVNSNGANWFVYSSR